MPSFGKSENLEVFSIEWEKEFHVFLLDPTKGCEGSSKIIDSCTLKKPEEYQDKQKRKK